LLAQTSDIGVISEAERGEEAYLLYFEHNPTVVVMDLSLPGVGGLATIKRICTRDPEAKILVFSMHDEPVYISRTMSAGAKGYISKSCPPETLIDAVRLVAIGKNYIEPKLAKRLAIDAAMEINSEVPLQSLSGREFDVFRLAAAGQSTRHIADSLHLTHKTVANYLTNIKSKLGVNTTAELTRMAYRTGILKEAP